MSGEGEGKGNGLANNRGISYTDLMISYAYVALGGAIGASLRYGVGRWALKAFGPGFPWGTFIANVSGGFLMGLLTGWLTFRVSGGEPLRLFLAVGVLGGFTTFSGFSLETLSLIETKAYSAAGLYIFGSVILALAAVFAGLLIARKLFAV